MRKSILALAIMALPAAARADVPDVVASVPPLQSLVASVMEGVGTPGIIVPATVSEHDYALKPSDVRKIAGADLIVWVGPQLETFLTHPLETEGKRQLALIDARGVDPVPFTEEEEEEAHDHDHADEEEHGHAHEAEHEEQHAEEAHHDHDHGGLDPHFWLDPVRAAAMVDAIAGELAELDPENAETYRTNAEATKAALEALNSELAEVLAPAEHKAFITFHEGYNYFVSRYGLNQVGHFTVDPQRRPGAATVAELRERVSEHDVACVFAEPQYDASVVESLVGRRVEIGTLDALGAGLEEGPGLYPALMRQNAEAVKACLAPTG